MQKRKIIPLLTKALKEKEVLVLTGIRQVGKTTLVKYLYNQVKSSNKLYLDLENPLNRKIFEEEDYDTIWQNLQPFNINRTKKTYLFLDEIQNLPHIPSVVKYFFDHYKVKFVLTGSSSFYLKNLFSESLSSRKMIYELFPLDFEEFLVFKGIKNDFSTVNPLHLSRKAQKKNNIRFQKFIKYYDEYMRWGGFPAVVLADSQEKKENLLQQIFTSYFEIDVKSLADFKNLSKLRDLILLLIPRVGSTLDISKLSSQLSVSRETVYTYLQFLEQTYFIHLLPKFSSVDRQSAGRKKLFLCDSGLARYLGEISTGSLFEQTVFQVLRGKHTLHYFYKNKGEIDFIVDNKYALEAKLCYAPKHEYNLKRRFESLKNLKDYYIVTHDFSDQEKAVLGMNL